VSQSNRLKWHTGQVQRDHKIADQSESGKALSNQDGVDVAIADAVVTSDLAKNLRGVATSFRSFSSPVRDQSHLRSSNSVVGMVVVGFAVAEEMRYTQAFLLIPWDEAIAISLWQNSVAAARPAGQKRRSKMAHSVPLRVELDLKRLRAHST